MNKEISIIIKNIKKKNIDYQDIPLELRNNIDIIEAERKSGMRVYSYRGYDVIFNRFFVQEYIMDFSNNSILETIITNFELFDDYYEYLKGNIYEKSCYYQCEFTSRQIKKYKIDANKIKNNAFIDYTIADDSLDNELENLHAEFKNAELKKEKNKLWINKVLDCKNLKELIKVLNNFEKSKYYEYYFEDILIYYFIKNKPKKAFKILMDAINNCENIISEEKMCLYFPAKEVLNSINYNKNVRAPATISRYIKKVKNLADDIANNNYTKETNCKFDIKTNYFIIQESYKITGKNWPIIIRKYFYDIKELIEYLDGNLSDCDLSKAVISEEDIKNCKINENTLLPLDSTKISHIVNKYYESEKFWVLQKWTDQNGNTLLERKRGFKYFFNYIYYLHNDLSNADLIFCEGLSNLKDIKDINFDNAHIRSEIMDKLGLKYEILNNSNNLFSFEKTINNEKETQLVLNESRDLLLNEPMNDYNSYIRVSYVSDIHLMHRLQKCKSIFDIEFAIKDIIINILKNSSRILLIGGDVSSNYDFYKVFITELAKEIKKYNIKVIFILGNHELWDFAGHKLQDIINNYKNLIISNDMYFIHNNLLYIEEEKLEEISEEEINNLSDKAIREKLKKANLVISGGIAFSGYNNDFNANDGIYRYTLNREQEINETKKFEKIYDKLTTCIADKHVIILTHTSKKDWSKSEEYVRNWVYVSGHTHRNYFYDDGEYRIYADNQLGYNYKTAFVKSFCIKYDYDLFSDYADGIYTITKTQYNDFYRGKNIGMDYNRDGEIFMLKKKGYYCFIRPSTRGLAILNGGALKSLNVKDVHYYYDNMDSQILLNKEPLEKYTKYQKIVSNQVREIGGSGTIHGSIIDIDFFNHIYVNPFDGTLSGYYASDIIDKYVFSNIPSLLKANCPTLYKNYTKRLGASEFNALIVKGQSTEIILKPTYYPSTDIYIASREIKKMQRLNNGILTVWHDNYRQLFDNDNRKLLK